MPVKAFFKNEKTGKKFEIVRFDKEAGTVVLRSDYAEFTEPYDKDKFVKLGYTLVREDVPEKAA